jgi:hypothetical protein
MNHLCFHADRGPHQCHCGIEHDHTTVEFQAWHAERGIPVLASQIA